MALYGAGLKMGEVQAAINRFTAAFKFWSFLLAAAEFWRRIWTPWQLE